ncbi:MAG: 50S ribosomal protein L23 [Rhodobacteraceae bacterium]|nr:50S ribosomal protein L23 [Paracoccaceae bacterium]
MPDFEAVYTLITKGNRKRFLCQLGRRNDAKKIYVTLKKGNIIDVSAGL